MSWLCLVGGFLGYVSFLWCFVFSFLGVGRLLIFRAIDRFRSVALGLGSAMIRRRMLTVVGRMATILFTVLICYGSVLFLVNGNFAMIRRRLLTVVSRMVTILLTVISWWLMFNVFIRRYVLDVRCLTLVISWFVFNVRCLVVVDWGSLVCGLAMGVGGSVFGTFVLGLSMRIRGLSVLVLFFFFWPVLVSLAIFTRPILSSVSVLSVVGRMFNL